MVCSIIIIILAISLFSLSALVRKVDPTRLSHIVERLTSLVVDEKNERTSDNRDLYAIGLKTVISNLRYIAESPQASDKSSSSLACIIIITIINSLLEGLLVLKNDLFFVGLCKVDRLTEASVSNWCIDVLCDSLHAINQITTSVQIPADSLTKIGLSPMNSAIVSPRYFLSISFSNVSLMASSKGNSETNKSFADRLLSTLIPVIL